MGKSKELDDREQSIQKVFDLLDLSSPEKRERFDRLPDEQLNGFDSDALVITRLSNSSQAFMVED